MRFIKYACAAFEIYLITSPSAAGGPLSNNNSMRATKLRSKDDLDVFDHFNGVVSEYIIITIIIIRFKSFLYLFFNKLY